jgi:predicted DNA-binding WGR domain protein
MDDERSPVRHYVVLHQVDPERRAARYYSLLVEEDLFGNVVLVRQWGRIGTQGRERVEAFGDTLAAGAALERMARAKRRRGYRDL